MLTVSAAFQRANVYLPNGIKKEQNNFKDKLKEFIVDLSKSYINSTIDDETHIKNIKLISSFSNSSLFKSVLIKGKLNFGVSQKLLNLYLKYLWCLDILNFPPPHFPVDREIQKQLKIRKPYSWTAMDDEIEYLNVIEIARKTLPDYPEIKNIAELELLLYKRRSTKK